MILYLNKRKKRTFVFLKTKGKKRKGSLVNYRSFAITTRDIKTEFLTCAVPYRIHTSNHEGTQRRIMVKSSLNEIYMDQLGNRDQRF